MCTSGRWIDYKDIFLRLCGDVLGKFNDFFEVRKNGIYERAQLNQRSQWEDYIAEQYIASLYSLTEGCEFGDTKDTRFVITISIRDIMLLERFKRGPI